MLGTRLIRRRLQRAEQKVQAAGAVGADLRQLAGRFRRLFLLLRRGLRLLRKRQSRRTRNGSGEEDCGQAVARSRDSQCHQQSLDAGKAACKAARRQRAVKARLVVEARGPDFSLESTLARLEAGLHLVDHINPALAADQTVVAVTTTQRFQRVTDLHGTILML